MLVKSVCHTMRKLLFQLWHSLQVDCGGIVTGTISFSTTYDHSLSQPNEPFLPLTPAINQPNTVPVFNQGFPSPCSTDYSAHHPYHFFPSHSSSFLPHNFSNAHPPAFQPQPLHPCTLPAGRSMDPWAPALFPSCPPYVVHTHSQI